VRFASPPPQLEGAWTAASNGCRHAMSSSSPPSAAGASFGGAGRRRGAISRDRVRGARGVRHCTNVPSPPPTDNRWASSAVKRTRAARDVCAAEGGGGDGWWWGKRWRETPPNASPSARVEESCDRSMERAHDIEGRAVARPFVAQVRGTLYELRQNLVRSIHGKRYGMRGQKKLEMITSKVHRPEGERLQALGRLSLSCSRHPTRLPSSPRLHCVATDSCCPHRNPQSVNCIHSRTSLTSAERAHFRQVRKHAANHALGVMVLNKVRLSGFSGVRCCFLPV
jgi:hypothetical protein